MAENLGDLVIFTYLGQILKTGSNRSKYLGNLIIFTYLGLIF